LKKLGFLSLSLLLLLFLVPGCVTFQAPAPGANPAAVTPVVPAQFSVTNVVSNTEPSTAGCVNLYANITTSGPGTVAYFWESADGGGYSYTWNITFSSAGTQKVSLPAEMRALPTGLYRLHVLTPNDIVSNSTNYTTCP
jgi:hypothetical protein